MKSQTVNIHRYGLCRREHGDSNSGTGRWHGTVAFYFDNSGQLTVTPKLDARREQRQGGGRQSGQLKNRIKEGGGRGQMAQSWNILKVKPQVC